VPATSNIKINPETGTLIRNGVESEVNPFDMYAIEEAIRLKEKHGGQVIAISMGPPQAEYALREALALGCDEAILLTDRKFAGADTLATSYTLSLAISKIKPFDLIICGHKTTDGDTGQVGPELAAWLKIPHGSYIRKIVQVFFLVLIALIAVNHTLEESGRVIPILSNASLHAVCPFGGVVSVYQYLSGGTFVKKIHESSFVLMITSSIAPAYGNWVLASVALQ